MDRRLLWLILGGLVVGLMLTTMLARGEHGQIGGKIRWEHKVVRISSSKSTVPGRTAIETMLNGLGKDGWELIQFEESTYILKRPAKN